jgi:DNA-binding CsgD family transcriptional regulator
VKDFAAYRGIAEGTARMQLKSALSKTGVGRQADLVRQVCQSLARL